MRTHVTMAAIALVTAAALLAGCPSYDAPYRVIVIHAAGATEYRCMARSDSGEHHFLSIIVKDGAIAIRPHPGSDPNGWGSTLYPQFFLAGAVLGHSRVDAIAATDTGIDVVLSGDVSAGTSSTFGTWAMDLFFDYDASTKNILGAGSSDVALDGPLSAATGDLNLYKIASNYLDDVPLLDGTTGDTGDMSHAAVTGEGFTGFDWVPPEQPAHFPAETTRLLDIDVAGQYNQVDSAAQGHAAIAAAFKPSLAVELETNDPVMTFGAIYDWSTRQDFWEDNVGITPLIRVGAPATGFAFKVTFQSQALPGDA